MSEPLSFDGMKEGAVVRVTTVTVIKEVVTYEAVDTDSRGRPSPFLRWDTRWDDLTHEYTPTEVYRMEERLIMEVEM
jgi:hypothetical protein